MLDDEVPGVDIGAEGFEMSWCPTLPELVAGLGLLLGNTACVEGWCCKGGVGCRG